jgi:tetratricopeptide (TPR) repeat protein
MFFKLNLWLILLVSETGPFQVVGETVSAAKHHLEWAQIESIDRRFVDYTEIDFDGRFVFKKVPEGLYKLTLGKTGVREEQRTIEVRAAFADERGRIAVRIEIKDAAPPTDKLKVGFATLGVSLKAVDEMRRAYEAKGDVEKARRHLQKAIEISPEFDEALNNLGTYYYREGRFDTAAALFQRALKANPNSFPAQVNLGGALISLKSFDRALVENLKAVAMRPEDSLAQSQTGQTLFYLSRYDEALLYLDKAQQIDPMSFTLPGIFIAQIRQIQGDRDGAIAEYQKFQKVHPGHPNSAFVESQISNLQRQVPAQQ